MFPFSNAKYFFILWTSSINNLQFTTWWKMEYWTLNNWVPFFIFMNTHGTVTVTGRGTGVTVTGKRFNQYVWEVRLKVLFGKLNILHHEICRLSMCVCVCVCMFYVLCFMWFWKCQTLQQTQRRDKNYEKSFKLDFLIHPRQVGLVGSH